MYQSDWHEVILCSFFSYYLQDSNLNGCKCPSGFDGDGYTCVGNSILQKKRQEKWYFRYSGQCNFSITKNDFYNCVSDIDECKEKTACQCDGCSCKNTWGGYDCKCKGNLIYIKGEDTCIGKKNFFYHSKQPLVHISAPQHDSAFVWLNILYKVIQGKVAAI